MLQNCSYIGKFSYFYIIFLLSSVSQGEYQYSTFQEVVTGAEKGDNMHSHLKAAVV
jgi:hypothetical protein